MKKLVLLVVLVTTSHMFSSEVKEKKEAAAEQFSEVSLPLDTTFPQCYFSPCSIESIILKLMSEENKRIRGAFYEFTLFSLAQAWAERKKGLEEGNKKLLGELIVDKGYQKKVTAALLHLHENGIPVSFIDTNSNSEKVTYANMHHKFFIFSRNVLNKRLLLVGSYNCTGSAEANNWENVVILDDENVIEKFIEEWKRLKAVRTPITKEDLLDYKGVQVSKFALELNRVPETYGHVSLFLNPPQNNEVRSPAPRPSQPDEEGTNAQRGANSRLFNQALGGIVAGTKLSKKCPECKQKALQVKQNKRTRELFIGCCARNAANEYCNFTVSTASLSIYK